MNEELINQLLQKIDILIDKIDESIEVSKPIVEEVVEIEDYMETGDQDGTGF
ncbi:hypothetical protein ACQV2X_05595 [Facklamia sp. P12945]|uniref:hypothetical protein n=1 Tax=Facklamia sp. P12945 TaxID=3421950 RepID=UPI003D16BA56